MADTEIVTPKPKKSCCKRIGDWIGSPSFYIYTNFFLGSWGDRMWRFSVGMYLVVLSDGLLRLAAIFGLCCGCTVLLFGGIIGNWVDRNGRLKVIRISLFIQNFATMLSALAVCVTIHYEEKIDSIWSGGLKTLCEATIVIFAIIAQLASVAYKIAIEKDWIVVVAGSNTSKLANLNAVIRAMDLSCKVLAPTSAGIIMYYASLQVSALVIAGWNLVSVFIEYALLSKVYSLVPELANKKKSAKDVKENGECESKKHTEHKEKQDDPEEADHQEDVPLTVDMSNGNKDKEQLSDKPSPKKERKSTFEIMFSPCIILFKSWRVYMKQKVVFAGLSLSFLYMTVLGFDSITVGFIYANGAPELAVGLCMGAAGVTGIIGTFMFTRLRPRIGLERTGLFAFTFEITLLSLCVLSIFAPGSLFVYNFKPGEHTENNTCISYGETASRPAIPVEVNGINSTDYVHNITKRDLMKWDLHTEDIEFDQHLWIIPAASNWKVDIIEGFADMGIGNADTQNIPSFYSLDLNIFAESNDPKQSSIIRNNLTVNHFVFYSSKDYHLIHNGASVGEVEQVHKLVKREVTRESHATQESSNKTDCESKKEHTAADYISVTLFLIGIVASRIGLWMADLTVTQLLQENVPENERGAVGGVQNSLNMTFDLLKFIVVIMVPYVETFGYLIIMSFCFIFSAGCLFAYHTYRVSGHCRCFFCCVDNNNSDMSVPVGNGKSKCVVVDENGSTKKDIIVKTVEKSDKNAVDV